jgi:hypothetical protein
MVDRSLMHSQIRAIERHGAEISKKDYDEITKMISKGLFFSKQGSQKYGYNRSIYEVEYKNDFYRIVFDEEHNRIVTFLPAKKRKFLLKKTFVKHNVNKFFQEEFGVRDVRCIRRVAHKVLRSGNKRRSKKEQTIRSMFGYVFTFLKKGSQYTLVEVQVQKNKRPLKMVGVILDHFV